MDRPAPPPRRKRTSVARTTLLVIVGVALAYAGAALLGDHLRFGGTDDRASSAILEGDPGYRRWISPLWAPSSKTAEVLLFGLQAMIGAGVLGFAIARLRGSNARDPRDVDADAGE